MTSLLDAYQLRGPHTYEVPVRGKHVTICGVWHDKDALHRHETKLRALIKDHDALVIESMGVDTPKGIRDILSTQEMLKFYSPTLNTAYRDGKPAYCCDHRNWRSMFVDYAVTAIAAGSIIGAARGGLSGHIEAVPALAASTAALCNTILGRAIRIPLNASRSLEYHIEDIFSIGEFDCSNVAIAHGIDTLCKETSHQRILAIHGIGHSHHIKTYLEHPTLRQTKRVLNIIPALCGRSSIWQYQPVGNRWELIPRKGRTFGTPERDSHHAAAES